MRKTGARFTFRANLAEGRHGWLRLTPAYSVGLVRELTAQLDPRSRVLDPFCGTATTALACAEQGIACDTIDINPFLVWFAAAKCANYPESEIDAAMSLVEAASRTTPRADDWCPPLANIERWWDEPVLARLAAAWRTIQEAANQRGAANLAKIAFCRAMMATSNANFRHQSVSLKRDISRQPKSERCVIDEMAAAAEFIGASARVSLGATATVVQGDSRMVDLIGAGAGQAYSAVITSPPYPNRMSYIRELRPYMYWLGFLADGRAAGELDWSAIGGTWGIATSNLARWQGDSGAEAVVGPDIVAEISARSRPLANYVVKYVHDMTAHVRGLSRVVEPGASICYIVGNSRFYGVPVETQVIFLRLFEQLGFEQIGIEVLRKRTSKAELFEYAVTAKARN